ncbi:MAG: DNA polymerase III subunit epsilon, partial [Paracoccaceae bacterium]
ILAEVYLELIGGRQPDFALADSVGEGGGPDAKGPWRARPRAVPLAARLTDNEAAAHDVFVDSLGKGALWNKPG